LTTIRNKMKELHSKIKDLKLRAAPVTLSGSYISETGELIDLKITATEEDRTVKGYLAVWGVKDDRGTVAIKGCFAKSIQERGPGSNSKYKIVFLWQHKQDEPIGQFTELVEDDYGLRFTAILDEVPTADRALKQIRSGTINQFSYGFTYVWDKMEFDEDMDAILMFEAGLWEGSAVTIGSCVETYAIRSKEQYAEQADLLNDETEDFIKSIPRSRQLELRQLFAKHISLNENKPLELRQKTLDQIEPNESLVEIGEYKLDLTKF